MDFYDAGRLEDKLEDSSLDEELDELENELEDASLDDELEELDDISLEDDDRQSSFIWPGA